MMSGMTGKAPSLGNAQAGQEFPMVQFHHEEKQTGDRRVDVSAGLTEGGFLGSTY